MACDYINMREMSDACGVVDPHSTCKALFRVGSLLILQIYSAWWCFFCKISYPSDFHCYTSSSHRHGHVNLSSIYNPFFLFINTDKLVLGHDEYHVFNYVSNLCAINQAPTGLRRKTTVEV